MAFISNSFALSKTPGKYCKIIDYRATASHSMFVHLPNTLLGKRKQGERNLPKDFTQQCSGWKSNSCQHKSTGQTLSRLEEQYTTNTIKQSQQSQMLTKYLNRMTVFQSIEIKSAGVVRCGKLRPNVILREAVIHAQILNPRRKAFIQPQVSPPFLKYNPPVSHDSHKPKLQETRMIPGLFPPRPYNSLAVLGRASSQTVPKLKVT